MIVGCVMTKPWVQFITGFLFGFYGIFVLGFIIAVGLAIYHTWYVVYRHERLKKRLEKILSHTYFEIDEINNFYTVNKEKLLNQPLYPIEIAVFRDQFETQFLYNHRKDYCECCICFMDEFKDDEKVISFPGCCHNFHYDCLNEWLKKRTNCPICKSEFREHFSQALSEKMKKSFMKLGTNV